METGSHTQSPTELDAGADTVVSEREQRSLWLSQKAGRARLSEKRVEKEFIAMCKLAEEDQAIASYVIETKLYEMVRDIIGECRNYIAKNGDVNNFESTFCKISRRVMDIRKLLSLIAPAYIRFAEEWRLEHDELLKSGRDTPFHPDLPVADSGHDALYTLAVSLSGSIWGIDPTTDDPIDATGIRVLLLQSSGDCLTSIF